MNVKHSDKQKMGTNGKPNKKKPSVERNESKSGKCKKQKTICKYPQNMTDASLNWKRLSLKLNSNKTNTNKKTFKANAHKNKSNSDKIWFDGVDKCLIKSSMADNSHSNGSNDSNERLVKEKSFTGLTRILAMDCEMVGTGSDGSQSVLARVSIVNFFGHCVYDKYVKPIEEVTDYRTHVSGIRPSNLVNAIDFKTAQKEVNDILNDRVIVGHALKNDFKVLFLSHPKHKIRDTSKYFKRLFGGRNPSLKRLSETVLGVKVQSGEHDSVEDARVAMRLFTMYRRKWELDIKQKKNRFNNKNKTKTKTKT